MIPEVMDGYLGVLTHNLILIIDIGRGKVYHDVNNKHDINWKKNILWEALKTMHFFRINVYYLGLPFLHQSFLLLSSFSSDFYQMVRGRILISRYHLTGRLSLLDLSRRTRRTVRRSQARWEERPPRRGWRWRYRSPGIGSPSPKWPVIICVSIRDALIKINLHIPWHSSDHTTCYFLVFLERKIFSLCFSAYILFWGVG